jgi:hypothetical protein
MPLDKLRERSLRTFSQIVSKQYGVVHHGHPCFLMASHATTEQVELPFYSTKG